MKKQGFTLIELMVVIVIMGILAAVAVPKLFGMIAKSKASEVGPAAGTYVKLQDAYISEVGYAMGNWAKIGYQAPGNAGSTTNFNYKEATAAAAWTGGTVTLPASSGTAQLGWAGLNKANLNDCTGDGATVNWAVAVKAGTNGGTAQYATFVNTANKCDALTANFDALGTSKLTSAPTL